LAAYRKNNGKIFGGKIEGGKEFMDKVFCDECGAEIGEDGVQVAAHGNEKTLGTASIHKDLCAECFKSRWLPLFHPT